MVAGTPPGNSQPTHWNDLLFGLLAAGECLVDDVRVLESPNTTAVPFIGNGGFEAGLTGWRVLGNHGRSHVIPDPDAPGNHVLHLIATGPQEHMHNHIEATLRNGASVVNGREYEISFRARWLTGNHLLNTRLYFNRCARTTPLAVPAWNGTPGAVNSRFATNLGPTFSEFQHAPVIPPAGSNVSVTVQASDPQGVTGCQLFWSLNGGAWSSTPMTFTNARYSGVIPGAPAGSIVQFHVQAGDGAGASYTYPARGRDSGALYVVADGQADLSRGRNVRLILSPSNRALLHASTNVMSNEYLPATVVCDESRAYYDVGVHLKGSERGRPNDDRVSFHVRFQPDDLFRGVHPHLLLDRSKGGSAPEAAEILIKHMLAQAGGIPVVRSDLGWLIAPFSTHTSSAIVFPRFEDNYLDESFPNGGDGTLWEYELIYSPTTTNSAGYKLPSPDTVKATAIQDLGDDPETYRYNFILKNHRDTDDYSRLIAFARSWSSVDTALEQHTPPVMDLDQWTRAYALVTLCGVGDAGSHNTLLYLRPGDERMLYFPWDMDFAFTQSATSPLVGDWLGKPNLQRIMNRPAHLRLLYANIQDVIASTYNPGYMSYWISHYNSLVPTASYGNVASYLQNRAAFASNKIQSDGGNAPFALTGPATLTTTTNLISLSGTAPVQARTLTVNGVAYPVSWTTLTNWSLRVPVTQASTVLQITVQDLRGNTLTQFSTNVTVQYTGAAGDPGRVVLNEIMAQPTVPGAGYVELYNSSPDHSFDLSGWRLNGVGYTFPPGTVLTNGQFLTLAANVVSHLTTYGTLPFAAFDGVLDPDGETLTLFRPGEAPGSERVVDRVRYEATPPWPPATNGASLQLLDAAQDNSRVANWGAVTTAPTLEWVYVTATGVPRPTSTPRALYLYLQSAGDIHLDDLSVVTGTVAQAGVNLVNNGGFEDGLAPWTIGSDGNNSASTLSTGISHSGNASLHLVASAGGTTRNSSIWQDCSPAIAVGGTYTLSFWFRQTANGGPLTVRFSGSGISVTTNPAPAAVTNVVAAATPGAANSLATNLPVFPPLWLNEVQVGNLTGASDNFGEREPWVELFNAGPLPLSLAGYFLTDTLSQPTQWPLPDAASVSATNFLVLWCDGQTQQSTPASPHASIRLTNTSGISLCCITIARCGG